MAVTPLPLPPAARPCGSCPPASLSGWELTPLCPIGAGFCHSLSPLLLFLLLCTSKESLALLSPSGDAVSLDRVAQSLVNLVVVLSQPPQPEAHQAEARLWLPLPRDIPHHVSPQQSLSTPSSLCILN